MISIVGLLLKGLDPRSTKPTFRLPKRRDELAGATLPAAKGFLAQKRRELPGKKGVSSGVLEVFVGVVGWFSGVWGCLLGGGVLVSLGGFSVVLQSTVV